MTLFRSGDFLLHSGDRSKWIIDCTALDAEDWKTLALMAVQFLDQPFGQVIGVPQGGLPFADALRQHVTPGCATVLVCDDVLTTGNSMNETWRANGQPQPLLGVVVFSRGRPPWWVQPLFRAGWS